MTALALAGSARSKWLPVRLGEDVAIPVVGARWAFIDAADLTLVSPFSWSLAVGPNTEYAMGRAGERRVFMHVLIYGSVGVDHRDRDGLNNRRANLRKANKTQNGQNAFGQRGETPFKGVAFHRHSGLYHATINHGGKQISLRYHKTPREAAAAYDEAALRLFGEFALTNKMMGLLDD